MRVLRGNDILINWSVFYDAGGVKTNVDFSNSTLSVFILDSYGKREVEHTVSGNVISIHYGGEIQRLGTVAIDAYWQNNNTLVWSRAKKNEVVELVDNPESVTLDGIPTDISITTINTSSDTFFGGTYNANFSNYYTKDEVDNKIVNNYNFLSNKPLVYDATTGKYTAVNAPINFINNINIGNFVAGVSGINFTASGSGEVGTLTVRDRLIVNGVEITGSGTGGLDVANMWNVLGSADDSDKQINIVHLTDALSGYLQTSILDDLFEKVNIGTLETPKYAIKAKYDFYSIGEVSAFGAGTNSNSGGGLIQTVYGISGLSASYSDANLTETFNAATIKKIYDDVVTLQSGSLVNYSVTGTGNAITGVSKTGNSLNFVKGLSFSEIGHTHTFGDINGLPTTLSGYGITDGVTTTVFNTLVNEFNTHVNSDVHLTTTQKNILAHLQIVNGKLQSDIDFYSTGEISAFGAGSGGSSGGGLIQTVYGYSSLGGAFNNTTLTDTFNAYTINQLHTRLSQVEVGAAVNVTVSGTGNAITNVTKNGNVLEFTKGSTFSLDGHTHDYVPLSQKGTANGVASLDANGLIISAQLPSYVDDVIEVSSYANLPVSGESGKIYVTTDTNITYRWTGTTYVEISKSIALGETSSTAYRGDLGAIAYAHSQIAGGIGVHISGTERTNWNIAYTNNHTHANKTLLDAFSQSDNDVLDHLSIVDGKLKVDIDLYSLGEVSAFGAGSGTSGSGLIQTVYGLSGLGGTYSDATLTDTFNAYTINSLHNRINTLEGGSALSFTTTGTGNAVTSIAKSGTVVTVTKGLTFSVDGHTHSYLALSGGTLSGNLTAPTFIGALIGNADSATKVNNALTFTGYSTGTFDGSAVLSIAIPNNTNQLVNGAGYLKANENITISGDASGSGATAITLTLANSGVTAGTYNNSATQVRPFTVDAKGRITSIGSGVTITPAWSSITSKPTTLSGYGITDAYTKSQTDTLLALKLDVATFNDLFEKVNIGTELAPIYAIKAKYDFYSIGEVSAFGAGSSNNANGGLIQTVYGYDGLGNIYDNSTLTNTFNAYTINKINTDLGARINSLESGSALNFTTTGSGNVVTSVTKSGTSVSVVKGLTAVLEGDSRLTNSRPNPYALTFSGYSTAVYDGSAAVSVALPTKLSQLINDSGYLTSIDTDLVAIAALTGTNGLLRKTAANTWSLDTNAYLTTITKAQVEAVLTGNITTHTHSQYLTGNQTITVSGDATGSGTTSIALTLANSGVVAGTYNNSVTQISPFIVDSKGRITSIATAVTITPAWGSVTGKPTTIGGYGITDAYTKTQTDAFLALKLDAATFSDLFEKVNIGTELSPVYAIKAKYDFYSVGEVSAFGASANTGAGNSLIQTVYGYSGLGGTYNDSTLTDTFNAYTINKINSDLNNRIASLEAGSALSFVTTGTGNAITSITKSGTSVTVTKELNFSVDGHTHSFTSITSKPTTLGGYGITDALPLSGGLMTGAICMNKNSLVLGDSFTDNQPDGSPWYGLKHISGTNAVKLSGYYGVSLTTGNNELVIPLGGNPTINGNTIWHSGNDGAGSGLDAGLLCGRSDELYFKTRVGYLANINDQSILVDNSTCYWDPGTTGNPNNGYGVLLNVSDNIGWYNQLGFGTDTHIYFRQSINSATNFGAWNTLAFITDNVASATKLQTARTIAGVSFDGSDNISIPFANLSSIPTTLSGYGITDAYTTSSADNTFLKLAGGTMTGQLQLRNTSLYLDHENIRSWTISAYNTGGSLSINSGDGAGGLYFNGKTIWHSGNDGNGSGLDADMLDGNQGSYYTSYTDTVVNGVQIGGRNLLSNSFVAGNNTTVIQDGVSIIAGANSDTYFFLKPASDLTSYRGRQLTLSFWVSGLTSTRSFAWMNRFEPEFILELKNGLNTLTFVDYTLGVGNILFDDMVRTSTQNTPIYLTKFKLELGNKATDWTPAPEDVDASIALVQTNLNTHTSNTSNPHSVTKAQVGLSNVDNTSDANKPVSTAMQTALNLKANLESPTFTGNVTAPTFIGALSGNASTATKVNANVTGTNSIELVRAVMADNDFFRILVGGTASNAGYAEIATADDGTEPIYVRQYSGVFASLVRSATLLDEAGNTSFPGAVAANRFYAGYDSGVANSISCSDWFRSNGNTGWYNSTYVGGIYMQDSTYVRVYNNKAFWVDNNIVATGEITAFGASDIRLKSNIKQIDSALDFLSKVKTYEFDWNEKALSLNPLKTKRGAGVIAQEMNLLDNNFVHSIYGDYLGVDYERFIPYLIGGVNEVADEVTLLKKRVAELELEIKQLKK